MSSPRVILTTNLQLIKNLRQKFGSVMPLYVVSELSTLKIFLEYKKLSSFYADSEIFTDEIKDFASGGEFSCKVFSDCSEIENLLKKELLNSIESSSKFPVLSDSCVFEDSALNCEKDSSLKSGEYLGKNPEKNLKSVSKRKSPQSFSLETLESQNKAKNRNHDEEIRSESFDKIIGSSDAAFEFRRKLVKAAQTDLPVLIVGETGSGKTLAANAIHEISARKNEKILEFNVNEISEGLFESTLFGHKKGAFTGAESEHRGIFEEAGGTTLFLDEIGELPKHLQAKLLRVIDKKEFFPVGASRAKQTDARLVFATNSNLQKKVAEGEFRQDLYRRIKNLLIEVPPLRKRKEDIPLIAAEYMKKHGKGKRLSLNAIRLLQTHCWPENIGELENCLNRAIVFSDEEEIGPEHIEF